MQKENVHILIVDDDPTLGKALSTLLQRAGYSTHLAAKPDEAITTVKFQPIHAAIVDCMLPKMSGRDLVAKLREESNTNLTVMLMSGIYKDKAFIRDVSNATGAKHFFSKPFDLEEFKTKVDEALSGMIDAPVERLQEFLTLQTLSGKERVAAVDEASVVHGFDLPWVYSLLMHPQVSGHLNIISADGEVSSVAFANGSISQVFQEDLRSYFGVLLVEHGFITRQELDLAIKETLPSKRLGEKLVESNLISPHAVEIVIAEQQSLRLARTITDTSVKVNFVEAEDLPGSNVIDRSTFSDLLNDWLISKITLPWLKSYYMPWMQLSLNKGPDWTVNHRVFSEPVVMRIPDFASQIFKQASLEQALANIKCTEDQFYRAVHALVVSRAIVFGERTYREDHTTLRERLNRVRKTLAEQNYFERLGVSSKAKDPEIKRNYHELAKVLHPDKLDPKAPEDVRALSKATFEMISAAYTTLSDTKARAAYVEDIEKGRAGLVLKADQLSETARPLLAKGDVPAARKLLEESVALVTPSSETRMLLMWAKLKSTDILQDPRKIHALSEEMSQIPAEDRHNSLFFFVKGLYFKASGDISGAKRNFEHVVNQDSDFIAARRELNVLIQQANASGIKSINDLFKGDLKDVVGHLFRKKK